MNRIILRIVRVNLRNQGVRLIGGCCGTTPEHIRALVEGVKNLTPIAEKTVKAKEPIAVLPERKQSHKTLPEKAEKRHTIIVELDAPKHLDITDYLKGAKALKEAGVDAITLQIIH